MTTRSQLPGMDRQVWRNHVRTNLFTRFRSWAFPTFRDTVRPKRECSRWLATQAITNCLVRKAREFLRCRWYSPLLRMRSWREKREFRSTSSRCPLRDACDRADAYERERYDHSSWTCADGTRGYVDERYCSAGMYASWPCSRVWTFSSKGAQT